MLAAARHRGGGQLADGRAVHVKGDASRHHLDVVFLQACGRAVVAGSGALVAGFDAGSVLLVRHGMAPSEIAVDSALSVGQWPIPARDAQKAQKVNASFSACAVSAALIDASEDAAAVRLELHAHCLFDVVAVAHH
jgi:hypothetical protein